MKIASTGICGRPLSIAALLLSALIISAGANTVPPGQRIEQEFRRLEAAVARCIYDDVLASRDLEEMNRALYDFMQENPGVIRVLRTNANGITVNDVRSDSPLSAPPRDIGGQQWYRGIAQNRRTHYSMDIDSATTEITLFYAWPLMTGADGARFSGAFAAMIDFTAQAALIAAQIDDETPFQIAFGGKPFFEHRWDVADFNEEPLNVRGTGGLTIRTPKPAATRLDPRPQRERSAGGRSSGAGVDFEDMDSAEYIASLLGDLPARPARKRMIPEDLVNVNTGIFVLLALIAAMLGYSIISRRRGAKRFVIDANRNADMTASPPETSAPQIPPPQVSTLPGSVPPVSPPLAPPPPAAPLASIPPPPPPAAPAPKPGETGLDLPVVHVQTIADGGLYKVGKETDITKEQKDAIGTVLKLIKDELIIIDKKINLLAQKVAELEKRKT